MSQMPPEQPGLEEKVEEVCLQDSVERAGMFCFLLAVMFGAYGATSLEFIQRFEPRATFWPNEWPRLAFNSLPLLLLGAYLRRSKASNRTKLFVWITAFSTILHVAAWIFVWKIALEKTAQILTYVHAANTFLIGLVYAVVAPPKRLMPAVSAIFGTIFLIPLFVVAYLSTDRVIFNLTVSDSLLSLITGLFVCNMINKLRVKVATLELEHTAAASKFLGPVVAKAIFENQAHRLKSVRCKGFVASIDVRGSTDLQKNDRDRWLTFRKDYFALVSEIVTKNHGYIQKTVGDCHVINFGVMDYAPDLSDIPGIEAEERAADERRLQHTSDSAFRCIEEIMTRFNVLALNHYPSDGPRLGAGMDKGLVERGVQGDGNLLELDVNGDPVNCSNRLQEYGKVVMDQFAPTSSLLVISPFASDYLTDLAGFRRVSTLQNPVRNYVNQIKWVLIREFALQDAASEQGRRSRAA